VLRLKLVAPAQLQTYHTTRGPRGEVREASRGVATGSARVMLDAL
jgi:hypothetical protein